METIILSQRHREMVRKIRKKHWLFHVLGILLTFSVLTVPYLFKLDRDLIFHTYRVAKLQFDEVLAKQELLTILRTRGVTLGQGLDIADVILRQKDIPISIAMALFDTESSFNPEAVSNHGAKGVGQLMPATAKAYIGHPSNNIHDPVINVKASLEYLKDLKGAYGEWPKALRAYNGGPKNHDNRMLNGYVERVMAKAELYEKRLR